MALALDTNIFIYAHIEQFPEHSLVRAFLDQLLQKPDPYYLSWQVCYEYVRVVTHSKILKRPLTALAAMSDLKPYLADPRCQILLETENHITIFGELLKNLPSARGNFIHDCHYATLLREHAITEIATTDSDFRKFNFLEVTNPLTFRP